MVKLTNVEFSSRPDGDVEVRAGNELPTLLTQKNREIIDPLYYQIEEDYPGAFKGLGERYKNSKLNLPYFKFLLVRGFIKCNFGAFDNKFDVDDKGDFHFEFSQCPLAGECKHFQIICNPKRNTKLSERELQVLELISEGKDANDIADKLFISPHTVDNHRKKIMNKLGANKITEIVTYYNKLKQG